MKKDINIQKQIKRRKLMDQVKQQLFHFEKNQGISQKIKNHCYTKIATLEASMYKTKEPVPFAEVDETLLKPIKVGDLWSSESFDCAWFKVKGEIPQTKEGEHVALMIFVGGEGECRDLNGVAINGTTAIVQYVEKLQPVVGKRQVEIPQTMLDAGKIDMWIEAGNNRKMNLPKCAREAKFQQADIVIVNDDIKSYYYDYLALSMQVEQLEKGSDKRVALKNAIDESTALLGDFSAENVAKANAILRSFMSEKSENEFLAYCVGHAHLDLAYLWPVRESKRKAVRTFTNALASMKKYENYVFGASQPQQFEWMEENEPEVFERLKEAVASGNIELQGGMWVEADSNVTSGESLIRQNVYGQAYWKEKFGKISKICWLPDAFGFSANLPQICKKSGMDYFLTTKISWNQQNKFPHDTFKWEGIDGSMLLTAFPPEKNYVSDVTPWMLAQGADEMQEKDDIKIFVSLFGAGDGGGGAGEGHFEMLERCNHITTSPNAKMAPASDYFEALEPQADKLATYKGELYLEKHQGTFTTQSKNKLYNRKIEFLLHNVEALAAQAIAKGYNYPKEQMDKIWKEFLLFQFHDIIPGSSIARVYVESVARYEEMVEELNAIIGDMGKFFETTEEKYAANFNSFDFDGYVAHGSDTYKVSAAAYGFAKAEKVEGEAVSCAVSKDSMENENITVKFDKNGEICSLVDKRSGQEYAKTTLNQLVVYEDKRLFYDAWDIDINYTKQKPTRCKFVSTSSKLTSSGAVRVSKYKYGKSLITQTIKLDTNADSIVFDTTVNWKETHKMMRANFESSVWSKTAICDIQMGHYKRSTQNETSIDKAAFEVVANKYVSLNDGKFGISYITDCKYGWRLKDGLASLNLLRGTVYPDPKADKGIHNFSYAIYVGDSKTVADNTAKTAFNFNNPPKLVNFKADEAFAKVSDKHVVLDTIKPAEDGNGIILRLYEDAEMAKTVSIELAVEGYSAVETNMLEETIGDIDLSSVSFTPFEIKTIRITK